MHKRVFVTSCEELTLDYLTARPHIANAERVQNIYWRGLERKSSQCQWECGRRIYKLYGYNK